MLVNCDVKQHKITFLKEKHSCEPLVEPSIFSSAVKKLAF